MVNVHVHASKNTLFIYRYGKSTSNQRIEALWSHLKPHILHWKLHFMDMVTAGDLEPGHDINISAARFCFTHLLQASLDMFRSYWNHHHIRQSAECPAGKPDELFFTPESKCLYVADDDIEEAETMCRGTIPLTGDQDIDDYYKYVMDTRQYMQPLDKSAATNLYKLLVQAAS